MKQDLRFREDGSFTIVQFTDMHFGFDDKEEDRRTADAIRMALEAERPDLIVVTGDLIWSKGVPDPKVSFRRALAPIKESKVPWVAAFGNHDAEAGVTREELLAIQQEDVHCLTERGPEEIEGVGNFVLTVRDALGAQVRLALYVLDSGVEAPPELGIGGYAWIHSNQIAWYAERSAALAEEVGTLVPALAFFHIPIPEYDEAWRVGPSTGSKGEAVCSPKLNSGLFASMVQRGDVMGTFVGHDHDNDYIGVLHGIALCYGRVTGYNTYGKSQRGARVIRLTEGRRGFETWIRQHDGTIVYPWKSPNA